MARFFSMSGQNNRKAAVARAGANFNQYELWDRVESLREPGQWRTLDFTLDGGILTDYPPSNLLGRICSPAMVQALAPFAKDILWLPVRLRRGDAVYGYQFMHFLRHPDVLDEGESLIVNGRVVKPWISVEKAADVPLICFYPLGKSIVVRSDVRDALVAARCKGIEFQAVATSNGS